ncbi:MAG: hypothetical protein IJN67_01675 [Oscillospiraceae bacterium]|nr:hypothetical protein [Oscillospiraceae bacterium]
MTHFTDSPYERMMTQKPSGGASLHRNTLPKDHPCYGCTFVDQVCVGICHRELLAHLEKGKKKQ